MKNELRKVWKLALAMTFCVLLLGVRADAAGYKKIYKNYLESCYSEWGSSAYFLIMNVDRKGSPELLIEEPFMQSLMPRGNHQLKVYTVRFGELIYCGYVTQTKNGKVRYSKKYKGLYNKGTGSGFISHGLVTVSGGTLKDKVDCQQYYATGSFAKQYRNKYKQSDNSYYVYFLGKKNVTKKKWSSQYKKYFTKNIKNYSMKKLTLKNINKI